MPTRSESRSAWVLSSDRSQYLDAVYRGIDMDGALLLERPDGSA